MALISTHVNLIPALYLCRCQEVIVSPVAVVFGTIVIVALVAGGILIVGLIRDLYDLRRRVEEVAASRDLAPRFEAIDLDGQKITSRELEGKRYGLLFLVPASGACSDVLSNLDPVRRRTGELLFAVCRGSEGACRALVENTPTSTSVRMILDADGELHDLFGIDQLPSILAIDEDGRVRSIGKLVNATEVDSLLEETVQLAHITE